MRKIFAFSLMAALVLASCSPKEQLTPTDTKPGIQTVRATIESDTRTYLVEDTDVYHMYWKAGDMIRCSDNDHAAYYQTQDNGVKSATFTFVPTEDPEQVLCPDSTKFWAYFPPERGRKLAAIQQYCENGIAAAPIRGFYQRGAEEPFDPVFVFKNICGAIKLNLTTTQSDVKVVSIVLKADNGLSGSYTNAPEVSGLEAIETYYKQVVSNTTAPVTLECPEIPLSETPHSFLISVPPFAYGAFSVTVITSDGRTQTRSMKAGEILEIERAKVYDLDLAFNDLQKPAVGATATFMAGANMNTAIKGAVNPDVALYTDDDSTVTKIVYVTNSDAFSSVNIADAESESPIYVFYDEATTTVTISTPAPKFVLNANSAYFFHRFKALKELEGIDDFDTSNVESMAYFWGYTTFDSIKMPATWDYSKLINTRYMFDYVKATSIDLSNMDFSADTSMANMFYWAENLNEIIWPDVMELDNLESIRSMFCGTGMSLIDISSFQYTSGVQRVAYMFADCPNLQKVIANIDLSAVTTTEYMFTRSCENSGKLDLTEFVGLETMTTCNSMFRKGYMSELDISTWNTSNIYNFNYTFYQMPNLSTLRLGPDFGCSPDPNGTTGKPKNTCMFAGTSDKTSGVKTSSVPGYLNIYTSPTQAEWLFGILTLKYLNGGYYDKTPVPVTFFDCDTGNPIEFTWPTYD